jgi:Flp pilus assembly secretin CpaC
MKCGRWFVAVALLAVLTGCASAVLVGGGEDRDDAYSKTSSADAAIIREVNRRLVADPQVPAMDVEVDAQNGMVTLTGRVPNRAAAQRAAQLARSVAGDKEVRNLLRVGR